MPGRGGQCRIPPMKKILVTGATGTIGRQVVSQLLPTDIQVRAMTRNLATAGLPSGVEVVRGDLTDPESLNKCLEGIDTVFLVWTAPAGAFPAALDQIARSARRVVLLTSPHKTPHPLFQQTNPMAAMIAEIERRIE